MMMLMILIWTWQCVVDVGMPAILQTITTTEAVSTTVKPKLKRKSEESHTKSRKNHSALHLIGLDTSLKITLASSCWSLIPSSQSPCCRSKPFLSETDQKFFSLSEIDHQVFLVGERKFEPSEMPRPPQRRIPYRGWFVEYPTGCLFTICWSYFENTLWMFSNLFRIR